MAGAAQGYRCGMGSYYQFCPVAKAVELLDERWTLLIVREMLAGSVHFNQLRRGVPRMSPTLLSKRLNRLVLAGIVDRQENGQLVEYQLTQAGRELRPIVEALGAWGVRWVGELGQADLDPKLMLWDLSRHVDLDVVPPGRTVVSFSFDDVDVKLSNWWLVLTENEVDVCDFDPGYEIGVRLSGSLRGMVEIWRGDVGWGQALRSGSIDLQGSDELRRSVPLWFPPSVFAAVPRVLVTN
jgi:DNA-binding HxlR family transcriptional regulator